MGRLVVCDAEFDSLTPTVCWVIVCQEVEVTPPYAAGHKHVFVKPQENKDFATFANTVTTWVGHNFIKFDLPCLARLLPEVKIDPKSVIDTLVVSRLLNYKIAGGHSVEAWAKRLRAAPSKIQISDWTVFTQDIVTRCTTDVEIQTKLYQHFLPYLNREEFQYASRLEHDMEIVTLQMEVDGFPFDFGMADALRADLQSQLDKLDKALERAFPPIQVLTGTITARGTKHGTVHATDFRRLESAGYRPSQIKAGRTYDIHETQVFNAGSLRQVIDRLWDAKWCPTDKTKGHIAILKERKKADKDRLEMFQRYGWKLSEENLLTLPDTAPQAARSLTERLIIASRVSDLEEWCTLARDDGKQFRLHAYFNPIGSWTHRLSTRNPNLQNIPVPQHKENPNNLDVMSDEINAKMRQLFKPEVGCELVGTDADGIQMRVFAHIINDEKLIEALVNGDKEKKTDIHNVHKAALGPVCGSRNIAKTFIYAFLLGGGIGMTSQILGCSMKEAKEAVTRFIEFYPGLKELRDTQIPKDARRGFFKGLDKRLVVCNNEHLMLSGYLQNGEAVIMKTAARIWMQQLKDEGVYYQLHTWPHDEWQTSARKGEGEYVGSVQANSLTAAGEILGLNLPITGESSIGGNWLDTH